MEILGFLWRRFLRDSKGEVLENEKVDFRGF